MLPVFSIFRPSSKSNDLRLIAAYVILWIATELLGRHIVVQYPDESSNASLSLALLAWLKLPLLCLYYLWGRTCGHPTTYRRVLADSDDISADGGRESEFKYEIFSRRSRIQRWAIVIVVSLAYASFESLTFPSVERNLPASYQAYIPLTNICIPIFLCAFLARPLHERFGAILLQSGGLIFAFVSLFGDQGISVPRSSIFTISASALFALLDHNYASHPDVTFSGSTIPVFAVSVLVHTVVAFANGAHTVAKESLAAPTMPPISVPFWFLLQAFTSMLGLAVIYHYDSTTFGFSWGIAVACTLTWTAVEGPYPSFGFISALAMIIFSVWLYVRPSEASGFEDAPNTPTKVSARWRVLLLAFITAISAPVALTIFASRADAPNVSPHDTPINPSAPHRQLPSSLAGQCVRRPLRSQLYSTEPRKYHTFDDILLIVFFSHARYGANLDYYKEVYSEYFPNIVFIGPASREDAGFPHSYDLMVDSYQSDEDLSDPTFYKMAGRMAHHMLYTAMMEHNCYEGYLWAPFDTLLNIPRLQLFDQTKFWYHSPWGQYIPNPAVIDDSMKKHHPPPARISPDPSINLTETWKGWQTDWWWGDPHVGLPVCTKAFERVPLSMRSRMAEFTDGQTRFVGGSSDTVYIPGRHRDAFMDVLSLFLETDCFLEIAVPTTVHLVVPQNEAILFVDHWWIWEPPFNATFVRQKWDEGFEVDTFHTFHWGEKEENGTWRGNHDHVADIRRLLRESALRQSITLP